MPLSAFPRRYFAPGSWLRAWAGTALVGNGLLAVIFVGYEIVERLWLRDRYSIDTLFLFHIYRGVGASLLLATWAFYNIWRLRRQYDRAFEEGYRRLEAAMEARRNDLVKANALTDRLFDALRDRLIVLDRDGVVVKANRIAVESCGGAPLVGHACGLLGLSCQDEAQCAAKIALRTGQPLLGHRVGSDRDPGRLFVVDAYPLKGPDGDFVIEVARDVTAEEHLQSQIRQQEKLAALGVLAAGIAHDIGNPLASISSELEMLAEEGDPQRARTSVGVLRGHVDRIGRVLRGMADFARRRTEEIAEVPVQVAVEDALRLVRHDPRGRRVSFETEVVGEPPTVRIVEDHLVMALVNLLINALDAMPDGGTLKIRTQTIDGHARLSVADSGAGMSEEVRRRATEPLFTTKPAGRGTGLGLAITADVVARAGGTLDIDSTPGIGTTVHVTLPRVARG